MAKINKPFTNFENLVDLQEGKSIDTWAQFYGKMWGDSLM